MTHVLERNAVAQSDRTIARVPVPHLVLRWRYEIAVVAVFVASRLVIAAGFAYSAWIQTDVTAGQLLRQWDVRWYVRVITEGYRWIPGETKQTIAFFPLYPRLVDGVARMSGLDLVVAGMVCNAILGVIFVLLVYRLGCRILDAPTALRATVLCCFFPGSLFLSIAYSEALMLVLACGALIALLDRRWILAGGLSALATATRPNALVMMVVGAVVALDAIRRRREWRALWAPALAPVGFVAYMVFVWQRTGNAFAWWITERDGWGERFDFGWTNLVRAVHAIPAPLSNWNDSIATLGLIVFAVATVSFVRWRPPLPVFAYGLGMVACAVGSATIGGRPRFIFVAFPLFYALARAWRPPVYATAVGISAAALMLYAVSFTEKVLVVP